MPQTISPYLQVAADALMEDPVFMRMSRDFLAQRREGRQNAFASIVSGGQFGGVGRVTMANLAGPDLSRQEALEAERADLIKEAVDARVKGLNAAGKMAAEQSKLAVALLTSSATVGAATAAASAVKYKANSDRITQFESDNAELLKQEGSLVRTLRAMYDVNAPDSPATNVIRAINGLPKGNFAAASTNKEIIDALGDTSALTAPQKAAARVALASRGFNEKQLNTLAPITDEVQEIIQTDMTTAATYADYLSKREEAAKEMSDELQRQGVGATTNIDLLRRQGTDVEMAQNLNRQLQALVYQDPKLFNSIMDMVKDPLPPDAKARIRDIDAEIGQIKSTKGGLLRNDAKTHMRNGRAIREMTAAAIVDSYDKRIAAVPEDDEEARTKLKAQRDALVKDIETTSGRRFQTALTSAQRRFQRGQLASEVGADGEVSRTKVRNLVAGEADRRFAIEALKQRQGDELEPAAIDDLKKAKDIEADVGVGQGLVPVRGRPAASGEGPAAAYKPASIKAKATDKDAEEPEADDEAEAAEAPAEDAAATLWGRPAKSPFETSVRRGDMVLQRLQRLTGKA